MYLPPFAQECFFAQEIGGAAKPFRRTHKVRTKEWSDSATPQSSVFCESKKCALMKT